MDSDNIMLQLHLREGLHSMQVNPPFEVKMQPRVCLDTHTQ